MIIQKYNLTGILLSLSLSVLIFGCTQRAEAEVSYTEQALSKISTLEQLMDQARAKSIDVTREETVLWFSRC